MDKDEVNAQMELRKAFEGGDLESFLKAIKRGANPNLIYEEVLSKPNSSKFIKACIDAGCAADYVNKELNKAAINYAAESESPKNLYELLHQHSGKLNVDHQFEGETALLTLSKRLTPKNIECISKCIHVLLHHGASPNLCDRENKSALQHILEFDDEYSHLSNLIIEFVKLPELNLNYYLQGLNALRQSQLDGRSSILYQLLVRQVLSRSEDEMETIFLEYEKTIQHWNCHRMHKELLNEHIDKNTENALNAVLKTLNLSTSENIEQLVEMAIEATNWTAVSYLIKSEYLQHLSKSKLLLTLIKQAELPTLVNPNYQKSLQQLLEDLRNCVNQSDNQRNTSLHYAVLYRNDIAIKELLKQGAKLGLRNNKNMLAIEDLDVKQLEEHFDYCITNRGQKTSHEQYEIIMNYMNLTNQQDKLDIAPIVYMAKSKELRCLLQHPLITCFLCLKWHRLSTMFYIHFLIFLLFSLSLILHVLLRFPQRISDELPILLLTIILAIMMGYMLIVDLFAYFVVNRLPSYIDAPLLVLVTLSCTEWGDRLGTQKIIAVFSIMLMAIKLIVLIGALPVLSISTHMLMLRQVTGNFLKCLAHYSLIVLTFGLCFYILLGESFGLSGKYLNYSNMESSFVKTLVMFSGEYDDDDFDNNYSSLLLIMFMFISMILTNLLGGLAVNDTQTIKAQVELNAAICRTKLLNSYEGVLVSNCERFDWLRIVFQKLMNIKADSSFGYLSIFPNQENRAEVYNGRHRNQSIESLAKSDNFSLPSIYHDHEDSSSSKNSNMDVCDYMSGNFDADTNAFEIESHLSVKKTPKNDMNYVNNDIVKRALQIIQKKSNSKIEEQHRELREKRQEDIWKWIMEQKK